MSLPLSQSEALIFFQGLPSIRPYYVDADLEMVLNLLENSKAPNQLDPPTIYYRPYWVAGYFLMTLPRLHELEKAEEGVTFAHMYVPIRANFLLQRAKDLEMGLIVPPGMDADPCVLDACAGKSSPGSSTGRSTIPFTTQSISRRLVYP